MTDPTMASRTPEIHKALADDTRFRLYRHLRLVDRPVSVREMARRLSLHANTLRPHLRRLEEAGLVAHQVRKTAGVGRPQTLYRAVEPPGDEARDFRLLAEMLCGLVRTRREVERATGLAREWGGYLVAQGGPKPGARLPARQNLARLQDAMATAGFEPRFRRTGNAVEVTLRDCPFRELHEDYRDLVCSLHRGLLEGMLAGLKPPLGLREFRPFAERGICRLRAAPARAGA
ncbi:MAG TPA: helix-turn-helix domain-containing protein [Actinomycetota bacterium]|nr:helix-turn-helix domain-containing protein [Actinomycetota bacterium]